MNENITTQLKDIHLPPAISSWPSMMTLLFVFIGVILLTLIIYFCFKYYQKQISSPARLALKNISMINWQDNNKNITQEINMLLKQYAIERYGRDNVANLSGEQWYSFLCNKFKQQDIETSVKLSLSDHYQINDINFNNEALKLFAIKWIKYNK